jgi:hypothetical protein
MHLKYLHSSGNESSESFLEAYGIVTKDYHQKDALRLKQCPNCNETNKPDGKFCTKLLQNIKLDLIDKLQIVGNSE